VGRRTEQQRIVAEIEKQFTRLDAGVASLKRVQTALKHYRASVLKAACEGRLVPTEAELARKENRGCETGEQLLQRILKERRGKWNGKGKYKEPAYANIVDLPELPEGWAWATLEELNLANRPCAYGVLQPGSDVINGIPFVRVGDIHDGKIDTRSLKRISPKIAAQYPRTNLRGGEFVITLVGAIGRTAIVSESLRGGNTARAVGIVPLSAYVNAHWVELWFRNPQKTAEMISKAHEVARKTLNLEDVRVATVALPPLAEQSRIVTEVDRRFSIVEELQALIDINCNRADRLRRATLQQAFAGGETSSRARGTTATF
jgi:type I restriction enzyme S subunit